MPAKCCRFHYVKASAQAMDDFPFDIVGFDLDGTLVDTAVDLGVALNHALVQAGRPQVPAGEVRSLIGGGGRRMLERALERDGGPADTDTVNALHSALLAHYEDNIAVHSRTFEGVVDVLESLAGMGVRLAVVTNKLERLAVRLLDELDLTGRFYTVIGGDTLGPGRAKPAPDLLHEMIARGGGGRAAYVGDSSYDTGASLAAGLPCVAVSFGFSDQPVHGLGAAAVIDHFDELVCALARLR
jgi:phosphoglycolate phosphatase